MAAEFTKIVPASALQGAGLVLPADFREAVVKEGGAFTLQNADGKQWGCNITKKQQGNGERADITGGFRAFASENGIQAGDEVKVVHKGERLIEVTKTGRTGTPRGGRTPKAAKASGKSKASTSGRKAAGKTPTAVASGGVKKARGGSSTAKKRQAAAAAVAVASEPEPEPESPMEADDAIPAGPLPEYVPPAPEYLQPIWPKWCTIM